MEKISATQMFNHWGPVLRMATKRPFVIESHGKPKAMLVPLDFKGRDYLDELRPEDIPSSARYSPQDVFSFLIALSFVRLRKKYPVVVKFNMELAMEKVAERKSLNPDLIQRLNEFLALDIDSAEKMLLDSSDWGAHLRHIAPYGHPFGLEEVTRHREKARELHLAISKLIQK